MDSVDELKNNQKPNFPSNPDTFKKMFKTSQQFETKRKLLKMTAPNPQVLSPNVLLSGSSSMTELPQSKEFKTITKTIEK